MPTDVVIASAARTPIATAYKGSLVGVDAFALAEVAIGAAVERAGIPASEIEDMGIGESMQGGGNIGRNVAVRLGMNQMSSISSGSTPARSTAAPIATSASANASTPMRDPLYAVAIGVRAALAMTTSVGLASLDISLPRVVAPQAVPDGVSDDATGARRGPNRDTARLG